MAFCKVLNFSKTAIIMLYLLQAAAEMVLNLPLRLLPFQYISWLFKISTIPHVIKTREIFNSLPLFLQQSSPNSDEVESEELEWQFQQENKTGTQAAKSRSGGNYFSSSAVPYGNHRQNLGSNDWIISNSQTSHGFGDRQRKDESKHFIEGAQDEHYVKPRTNHNQQELLQQQQIHPEQFSSTSNSIDRFGSQIQQQLQSKGSSRNSRNGRGRSNMKFPTTTRTPDVFVFPLGLSDQVLNG